MGENNFGMVATKEYIKYCDMKSKRPVNHLSLKTFSKNTVYQPFVLRHQEKNKGEGLFPLSKMPIKRNRGDKYDHEIKCDFLRGWIKEAQSNQSQSFNIQEASLSNTQLDVSVNYENSPLYTLTKKCKFLIVIAIYNEKAKELDDTLNGIFSDLKNFIHGKKGYNCKPEEIGCVIVADGIEAFNKSFKAQHNMVKKKCEVCDLDENYKKAHSEKCGNFLYFSQFVNEQCIEKFCAEQEIFEEMINESEGIEMILNVDENQRLIFKELYKMEKEKEKIIEEKKDEIDDEDEEKKGDEEEGDILFKHPEKNEEINEEINFTFERENEKIKNLHNILLQLLSLPQEYLDIFKDNPTRKTALKTELIKNQKEIESYINKLGKYYKFLRECAQRSEATLKLIIKFLSIYGLQRKIIWTWIHDQNDAIIKILPHKQENHNFVYLFLQDIDYENKETYSLEAFGLVFDKYSNYEIDADNAKKLIYGIIKKYIEKCKNMTDYFEKMSTLKYCEKKCIERTDLNRDDPDNIIKKYEKSRGKHSEMYNNEEEEEEKTFEDAKEGLNRLAKSSMLRKDNSFYEREIHRTNSCIRNENKHVKKLIDERRKFNEEHKNYLEKISDLYPKEKEKYEFTLVKKLKDLKYIKENEEIAHCFFTKLSFSETQKEEEEKEEEKKEEVKIEDINQDNVEMSITNYANCGIARQNEPSEPFLNLIFCIKQQNKKKLNSHRWFLEGFCTIINPTFIMFLDVGTIPKNNSLYSLYYAMEKDKYLAGCCGEIIPISSGYSNMVVNAQIVEYKFSHIMDKALESVIGYVSVLPGAFSAYRWDCFNEAVLSKYFHSQYNPEMSLFKANMYLAEDRILCLELMCMKGRKNILRYVKDSQAETDVPQTLERLMAQRRRWINGSWFSMIYSINECNKIGQSDHGCLRKTIFRILMVYYAIVAMFNWVLVGAFYIAFAISLKKNFSEKSSNVEKLLNISTPFIILYVGVLIFLTIASLSVAPKKLETAYKRISYFYGLYTFATIILIFYFIYSSNAIENIVVNHAWRTSISLISIGVITFFFAIVICLNYKSIGPILIGLFHFLFMTGSYVNIFLIYSICNFHDCSWGNRPDKKTEAEKKMDEQYQNERTRYVMFWIVCNGFFVYFVELLNNSEDDYSHYYLNGVAGSAFGIIIIKCIGGILYFFCEKWYHRWLIR